MAAIPYDDTRADWGARPPTSGGHRYVGPDAKVGVAGHWSGNLTGIDEGDPHQRCLDKVRDWQSYHMSKGWRDLGYHVLICVHARIIEGAAGGPYTSAAHVEGDNTAWIGLQWMRGTDGTTTERLNPAMQDAGVRVYDALCEDTGRTLRREGHKDLWVNEDGDPLTACPGAEIEAWWTAPTLTGGGDVLNNDDKVWLRQMTREESYRGTWQTDEKMDATDPTPDNSKWWPEAVVEDLAQRVKRIEETGVRLSDADVGRIVDGLAERFTVSGDVSLTPKDG